MHILFVCTGNTCRSPMAQGLFSKLLKERGIDNITTSSAGLFAQENSPACENAVKAAGELGADIYAHRAHSLTAEDAKRADLIICMSDGHREMLARIVEDGDKLRVLSGGIADPYGGDIEVYSTCAEQINTALKDLLEEILRKV